MEWQGAPIGIGGKRMFAIQCTTCGSRLGVKNDELIGQILACPKCGGMVLVERPEESTPMPILPEKPASGRKVFPDFLTSGTDSGLINVEPEAPSPEPKTEAIETTPELFVETPPVQPPPVPLSLTESELRTRKFLLGILAGLLVLLISAVLILTTQKENRQEQQPLEQEIPAQSKEPEPESEVTAQSKEPEPEPEVPAQSEEPMPEPEIPAQSEEPMPEPEVPAQSEEPAPIRSTTDLLSKLESKLPGLIEPSAMLSIDIPDRLGRPLAGLTLKETPLVVALRTLSTLTEIPMTLDVDQFRCRGIRIEEPITQRFEGGTIGELLTQILEPFRLEPVIEDRQILVTVSPERRDQIMERTFDVSDLAAGTENVGEDGQLTAARLAEILRRLVDPAEKQASIRAEGDTLVVRNTLRNLDAALRTLEQLRVLRNLPQTTDVTGELLIPEAFGWDAVEKPLTLNYYQSTPLARALEQVETATGLRILVDHQALHRALTPLGTITATVRCDGGTVNEALEKLLDSVNIARLTYRIVDAGTLEVTTRDVARKPEKMSVEVYRYETPETPLPKDETVEQLVRTIRSALEPESWGEPGQGDIVVDRPSGCLLVRQSQPVQRQLRLWFGRRLETPPETGNGSPERSEAQ